MVLPTAQALSLEAAIRTAASEFDAQELCFGHGTQNAIDEASWLILHALDLSPVEAPDYSAQLSVQQIEKCNVLLQRRIKERIPTAYLTGEAWFAGRRFLSDKRALVPRSPLAEFITHDFFGALDNVAQPAILDLCTGGGCIAIASAYAAPKATVHASDLSSEALDLARENCELHNMQERVQLFQGSLFEPLSDSYDLIISNPPYVDAQDIAAMADEFSHEPMMGLASGDDGLDLVRVMLREAAKYLKPNGTLIVEVGNSWEALELAYPAIEFSWLEFMHGGLGVFSLKKQQLL